MSSFHRAALHVGILCAKRSRRNIFPSSFDVFRGNHLVKALSEKKCVKQNKHHKLFTNSIESDVFILFYFFYNYSIEPLLLDFVL